MLKLESLNAHGHTVIPSYRHTRTSGALAPCTVEGSQAQPRRSWIPRADAHKMMKIATNASTPKNTMPVMVSALAFCINHQTSPTDWRLPAKQLEVINNLFRILWCSHTMHTVGRNGANQRRHTKCQRGILRPFCWACHLSTAKAHETTMFTVASNAIRIKAACMIDTGLTPWVMRTRQPPTELSHMDATQTRNTEHHFTDCCATLYMSYCVLPCLTMSYCSGFLSRYIFADQRFSKAYGFCRN